MWDLVTELTKLPPPTDRPASRPQIDAAPLYSTYMILSIYTYILYIHMSSTPPIFARPLMYIYMVSLCHAAAL
jgi:hypothetical protein